MKVYEAKQNIQTAVLLLHKLKQKPQNEDDLKEKINGLLDLFTPNVIEELKINLKKNFKKRNREKRRRTRIKQLWVEALEKKRSQVAEVDRLFYQHQEQIEKAKTEDSVRRQADAVLHAVTRRKADARRILTLLPALAKLRAGRCQQDVARSITPSAAVTEAFEAALEHLSSLWKIQLEGYGIEEAGLKVMLAEGSATSLGRAERDLDAILHQWRIAMFGEGSHPEMTRQQLVSARAQWDKFAVAPDTLLSSGIPTGWLLPQQLNDDSWANAVLFD